MLKVLFKYILNVLLYFMRYNDWEMNVISVGYTSNEREPS